MTTTEFSDHALIWRNIYRKERREMKNQL